MKEKGSLTGGARIRETRKWQKHTKVNQRPWMLRMPRMGRRAGRGDPMGHRGSGGVSGALWGCEGVGVVTLSLLSIRTCDQVTSTAWKIRR